MSNQAGTQKFEATDQDFAQTVVERSYQVPVLVDFWAPWCAPCRTLGPVLEKLAEESDGKFVLAKVNVDENQQLAYALQIRSIPAVKLIIDGKLKDEFMGAYPEPMVREFLEHNLPSPEELEAKEGVGKLKAGDTASAKKMFQETLANDPKNAKALVGLGLILIDEGDLEEAKKLLSQAVEKDEIRRELTQLRAKVFLAEHATGEERAWRARLSTDPKDLEARFALACHDARKGRFEPALAAFLDIVKKDRKFKEDAGRKGMVAVFDLLPPDSPLTSTYRGKLSSILFS
jgi:putative thioredoxin